MNVQARSALSNPAIWLAVAVAVLCVALYLLDVGDALRFDRHSIDQGQWLTVLSGNFVHLGAGHLWMNMGGLLLVVSLIWQRFNVWEWAVIIVLSSIAVGAGLYWLDPDVTWYVGFSGTLHALIVAGCLADLKYYPKSTGLLLVGVIAKLVWEQFAGALPGSESMAGGRVVVNAHLYGAVAGAVLAVLLMLLRNARATPTSPAPPA